jgi:hypothetical protein
MNFYYLMIFSIKNYKNAKQTKKFKKSEKIGKIQEIRILFYSIINFFLKKNFFCLFVQPVVELVDALERRQEELVERGLQVVEPVDGLVVVARAAVLIRIVPLAVQPQA